MNKLAGLLFRLKYRQYFYLPRFSTADHFHPLFRLDITLSNLFKDQHG